ncbi:MAG TPA: hypothetical protein VGC42_00505 [Kofleriaceae bacterium]
MLGRIGLLLVLLACHPSSPTTNSAPAPTETQAVVTAPPPLEAPTPQNVAPEQGTPGTGAVPVANPGEPTQVSPPSPAGGPSFGEHCAANDACASGLTCVTYRGIAGARGPEFKTCEMRCGKDSGCPQGKRCATIADGPGRVCR